jgi:hypothetical protein
MGDGWKGKVPIGKQAIRGDLGFRSSTAIPPSIAKSSKEANSKKSYSVREVKKIGF